MVHTLDQSIVRWNRNKWLILPVLLVIATFTASLRYGFVSDDRAFLIDNSNLLSQPVTEYFQHGVWEFSKINSQEGQLYRPLALLTYRLQAELWGSNPMGYHFTNVLAHLLVTVLVFFLLSFLVPAASGKSLALATSIFAIHPVQVEAVCWIMGNNDIWAALWSFIGILLLFRVKHKKQSYFVVVALAAILAAMLTKEVAYTLPGLMAILLFINKDTFNWKRTALLTAMSGILLLLVLSFRKNAVATPNFVFNLAGVEKAIEYFLGYLKMTFLPLPQRFYLTEPVGGMVVPWEMVIGFAVFSGFCVLIWQIKEGRRFFILSGGWYVSVLAPALAVSFHAIRATFAVRVLYLAIFSLSMIMLWLLTHGPEKRRRFVSYIGMVMIALFMSISIWTRSAWKDQGSFLQLALASTPDNIALHIDMGDFYMETGKMDEAIDSYKLVVAAKVNDKEKIIAHERLGEIYASTKAFDKARSEFEAVLIIEPESSSANNGLGNIAWLSGDLIAAKAYYEMSLSYDPENIIARKNLATVQRLISVQSQN